jgi:hypothetical protein
MRYSLHRNLLFCIPLLLAGCGDVNPPTIPDPKISTTAISPTSVSLSWTKAADTRSDPSALVYNVYLSGPNPAYNSFDTIGKVEAGTLVQTLRNASSITISSGISAGNAYYINIVVQDTEGNKSLYDPSGEYFHANQISYYPFSGNTNDVTATANHLVIVTAAGFALPALTLDRFSHTNSAYNFALTTPQCLQSTTPLGISGNASRSVSLWAQASSTLVGTPRAPFSWGDGNANGSNFGLYESGAGTDWVVWLSGTADVSTATTATSGWEHWVIGYDSATDLVYTYKNGAVVNNGTAPAVVANTVDTLLYVGCGMNAGVLDYPFKGNIDDVRIFNQLLSSTEVANLYAVTRP